jgi:hypothetical protein
MLIPLSSNKEKSSYKKGFQQKRLGDVDFVIFTYSVQKFSTSSFFCQLFYYFFLNQYQILLFPYPEGFFRNIFCNTSTNFEANGGECSFKKLEKLFMDVYYD